MVKIIQFDNTTHRQQVISLWKEAFGYSDPHNAPEVIIDKKLQVNDDLFLVAVEADIVFGTVLAGYDGHRGWIYSLAVAKDKREQGIGSQLLKAAESKLLQKGAVKINLQLIASNHAVEAFYHANGYQTEPRISMGKRFPENA